LNVLRADDPAAFSRQQRKLSAGVELLTEGRGAHARVWAPACRRVDVLLIRTRERTTMPLRSEEDGFFGGELPNARAGDRYFFVLDGERERPDPVSRFQPDGPHGPSEIIDPAAFHWTDAAWQGIAPEGHVIYEMHVGTFTPEGTWRAAAREIDALARLGVTIIEMMPVADFAGRFGWGYDAVDLYAPTRLYGRPDDLRRFVDRAHSSGIGVILDVVYNHLGPDGNYLAEFSFDYFTDRYENDWGQALNFEGPRAAREFFLENATYWIDEFHVDGFRLDATQDIHDASERHFLAECVDRCRRAAGRRRVYIVAENEPQQTRLVRGSFEDGFGMDALWNDDYHHAAIVALTGRREAYYHDYKGSPQEFVSAAKYGFLYQGQWYQWQKQRRGTPSLDLPGHKFVTFLENHDQVANTPFGRRLHQIASPGRYRALTALTLLGPGTPMLFQGQEFASSAPFLYFCDHRRDLGDGIRKGRREFLSQFASTADPEVQAALPDPVDIETFRRCKLDFAERQSNASAYRMHRDLLEIRRTDDTISRAARRTVDGAVLSPDSFVLRYRGESGGDRVLIVNLGPDLELAPVPEPLLAPPAGLRWELQWSSESVAYGGLGRASLSPHPSWHIPGETAVLLRAVPDEATDGDGAEEASRSE
jgi:maltooligosyltrehalose trehalohydrolase